MKYFLLLLAVMVAACNTSSGPRISTASTIASDTIEPFAPGGIDYVSPGTFIGTWYVFDFQTKKTYTNSCTVVIKEADSAITGTIINDYTKEVLQLSGVHGATLPDVDVPHPYRVHTLSSFGVPDSIEEFNFSGTGDSLGCLGTRFPPKDSFDQQIEIECVRQSTTQK